MPLPEGWYQVAGDPPGTQRYWDGDEFTTPPRHNPNARGGTRLARHVRKNELSGLSTRTLAMLIDLLAPAVIIVSLANGTGWAADPTANEFGLDFVKIAFAYGLFQFINQVVLLGMSGRSLGKVIMGLRVVRIDNPDASPGLARGLMRALVWLVPVNPVVSGLMLFMGKRRTLNDYVAGTVVVYA